MYTPFGDHAIHQCSCMWTQVKDALVAVEEMHISLGMTDVPFVAEAIAKAGQSVKECGLMVQTASVGVSMLGKALQKATTLIESAQRAVDLHKQRQDELARCAAWSSPCTHSL